MNLGSGGFLHGGSRASNQSFPPSVPAFQTECVKMSSKTALRPRSFFLKKQGQQTQQAGGRMGFLLHKPTKTAVGSNGMATKESVELKDYAERMMREQKMSSQKLSQLVGQWV